MIFISFFLFIYSTERLCTTFLRRYSMCWDTSFTDLAWWTEWLMIANTCSRSVRATTMSHCTSWRLSNKGSLVKFNGEWTHLWSLDCRRIKLNHTWTLILRRLQRVTNLRYILLYPEILTLKLILTLFREGWKFARTVFCDILACLLLRACDRTLCNQYLFLLVKLGFTFLQLCIFDADLSWLILTSAIWRVLSDLPGTWSEWLCHRFVEVLRLASSKVYFLASSKNRRICEGLLDHWLDITTFKLSAWWHCCLFLVRHHRKLPHLWRVLFSQQIFFSQAFFDTRDSSSSFLSLDLSWKLSGPHRRITDDLHALYFLRSFLILLCVVIDILWTENQNFPLLMTVLFVSDDDFFIWSELTVPDIEGTWLFVFVYLLDASVSLATWVLAVYCLFLRPFAKGRRTLRQFTRLFWTEIWVWSLIH